MYNNSHIKWTHGMELSAEVFQHQDSDFYRQQQFAIRTTIGEGKVGILPGTVLNADGSFIDRTFEFPMLQCTALLPSGRIISIEEPLKITLPHLTTDTQHPSPITEYFICLGFAEGETHEFECDGIPYEGSVYQLTLHTLDEIYSKDLLPLKRLVVKDDMLSVDANYIVPTLTTTSDKRIGEHINKCCEALEKLVQNDKLRKSGARRVLFHILSRLKGTYIPQPVRKAPNRHSRRLGTVIDILHELTFAIDFYIVRQMGSTLEAVPDRIVALGSDPRRVCDFLNIDPFFDWMEDFIDATDIILEQYVVKDDSIDIDKLKAEIKAELTGEIMQQLYDKLSADLTESLTKDLTAKIENIIQQATEQLKPELREQLHELLHTPLYNELYEALLNAISSLSYKPKEVVDTFVPLI